MVRVLNRNSLKGRNNIAQGNALKGQDKVMLPLQGANRMWVILPQPAGLGYGILAFQAGIRFRWIYPPA